MKLYVGTSGYSYKEWKGTFYPKDLPAQQMLRYYGEHFRTVEINYTFRRLPTAAAHRSVTSSSSARCASCFASRRHPQRPVVPRDLRSDPVEASESSRRSPRVMS